MRGRVSDICVGAQIICYPLKGYIRDEVTASVTLKILESLNKLPKKPVEKWNEAMSDKQMKMWDGLLKISSKI